MKWMISGAAIPPSLPYAREINAACSAGGFWPLFAYAVACNETIIGELAGKWNAATVESDDGGRGLFQLTSSYPADWRDASANARYAVEHFLARDAQAWHAKYGLSGDALVKATAASFNAGYGTAVAAHLRGNVDLVTTDAYGARAVTNYHRLLTTGRP